MQTLTTCIRWWDKEPVLDYLRDARISWFYNLIKKCPRQAGRPDEHRVSRFVSETYRASLARIVAPNWLHLPIGEPLLILDQREPQLILQIPGSVYRRLSWSITAWNVSCDYHAVGLEEYTIQSLTTLAN